MTLAHGRAPFLGDIAPAAAARLGVTGFEDRLGLPDASHYVVVVVDGLGERQLREHAELAPFLTSATSIDGAVCGVPSTTATSLTTLGTGLRAGQHGVVGYSARVPETGQRLNALKWDADVTPEQWQPHPTVFERVRAAGVESCAVNQVRFEGSGLTRCSQRGVPFHGVRSTWDRLEAVLDVVESHERSLVYAYESELDHTGHGHGVASQDWRDRLAAIDRDLADLRRELPSDALLVVTADHGMIDVPADDRFDVDAHPRLLDDVEMLAGEARLRHLYTVSGGAEDVASRWRDALGDQVQVRTHADGLEDWFGPIDPAVRPRLGDVVVACTGDFAVFSSREFPVELTLVGVHGSVTDAELAIPLLLV